SVSTMLMTGIDESMETLSRRARTHANPVSQRRVQESNAMSMMVEQRRGSIRENRAFWLAALIITAMGVAAIALAWAAAGPTVAAAIMLVQLGAAFVAGFR
ncbi:MAG TPA: hypothetical protein VMM78_06750, partial [Thermomicrobiales bacterium]|nr:hypothetical protein [Thermomicrobiales bacterium]